MGGGLERVAEHAPGQTALEHLGHLRDAGHSECRPVTGRVEDECPAVLVPHRVLDPLAPLREALRQFDSPAALGVIEPRLQSLVLAADGYREQTELAFAAPGLGVPKHGLR